jgi:hypothetical protein
MLHAFDGRRQCTRSARSTLAWSLAPSDVAKREPGEYEDYGRAPARPRGLGAAQRQQLQAVSPSAPTEVPREQRSRSQSRAGRRQTAPSGVQQSPTTALVETFLRRGTGIFAAAPKVSQRAEWTDIVLLGGPAQALGRRGGNEPGGLQGSRSVTKSSKSMAILSARCLASRYGVVSSACSAPRKRPSSS